MKAIPEYHGNRERQSLEKQSRALFKKDALHTRSVPLR